ncbi:MAG: extracellular solute-binding protein [Rickettsiales bacterium]|nr:extracellular solute-binding protein [Rickettsiales bacterium]
MRILFLLLFLLPLSTQAASWNHALVLFGSPKYSADFTHFDYAHPNAPKGGTAKMASSSSFDSVNAFILKGVKAPGLNLIYDSLMTGALDEPQTYYPLLAKRFKLADDKSWIEFELNSKATWQDGRPVTPEDVIWTLETLKTKADPVYRITYQPLEKADKTGPNRVRITFTDDTNREAPILAATLPILPKHYYETVEFERTTLTPPVASGPYRISQVDVGRSITYQRNPDYWGKNLPVNRGHYNMDTLRYDVYRDSTIQLEALKAGEFDIHREYISRNWATAYDSPAVKNGRLIKIALPDATPQGMQAFFFNLRQPDLSDRAVREAIALTMDFEWTNKALFYGAYLRNASFFGKTQFAATGLPSKAELILLEPFRDSLPAELFTQEHKVPASDGSGQNRDNLLKAQAILKAAGYELKEGKRINPVTGKPLSIEFMLNQPTMQRVIMPMLRGLKKLGIEGRIRLVDDAQYQRRVETRDFDIVSNWINLGVVFPGIEQVNYWHSSQAKVEGSNNMTGMSHPAVDAMLTRISQARTLEDLEPAARALDRILLHEQVIIAHWYSGSFRMAFWNKFGRPKTPPQYGLGFDTWWIKPEN